MIIAYMLYRISELPQYASVCSSTSLMNGVNTMLTKGKEAINTMTDTMSGLYQGAMSNLHEIMDKITSLKFLDHPLQNIKDKIDQVVSESILQLSSTLRMLTAPSVHSVG